MSKEFLAAVKQIASEKNIDEEMIIDAVQSALITAYRKDYWNKEQEIEVEIEWWSVESATVYIIKEVVEEVEDGDYEISISDAKKIKSDIEEWDEIRIDVTPMWYWRIAAQSAKQVILQKINEAEKLSMYERFKDREWSIIYWIINRVEWTMVTIEVERFLVWLTYRHQIPWESYFNWKRIALYLEKVQMSWKWPQIIVSRASKYLVEALLEKEIPEILDWDVEIKWVARDAWNRSKVAVWSDSDKVDPIWACVWFKWSRINVVTDELWWERIDMLEWDPNPAKLIARTLQPANIAKVIIINNEEYTDDTWRLIKKRAAVFVEEEQRAMAIWKKWQNIQLATNLTWYELDMYNIEELEVFEEKLKELEQESFSYSAEEEEK